MSLKKCNKCSQWKNSDSDDCLRNIGICDWCYYDTQVYLRETPKNNTLNMQTAEPKYFIKINDKFYPILEWDIRVDNPKIPIGCVTFAFNPPCGRETISYNLAKYLGIYEEKTEKALVKDLV